jgi:DNA repair exonuclease SbcCD ATPase subunit
MAAERRAGGEVALKSFDKILASVAAKQKKMRLHVRTGPPGAEDELLAQKSKGGGSPGIGTLSAASIADAMGFRRAEDDIEELRRRVQRRDEMICLLRRQLAQEAAPLYRDSESARQESRSRIRDRIKDDALLSIELEEEADLLYRIVDAKDRALEQFKQRVVADAGRIKDLNDRIERLLVESSERIRTLEYEKRGHLVALQGKDRLLERYQADRTAQNERILMEEVKYKELEEEKQDVQSKLSAAMLEIERLRREVEARDEELRRRDSEKQISAQRMDSLTAEYEEVKRR